MIQRNLQRVGLGAVIAALALWSSGCATGYGRFAMDSAVAEAFRSGDPQPGYDYYYAGRESMPYAIIGLERGYALPSRFWIPFDPAPDRLMAMSANLYDRERHRPYGAHILDPSGKVIGVWYSTVYQHSVAVDPNTRAVQVLFPNPEADDRY